jgi:hypothetical protein
LIGLERANVSQLPGVEVLTTQNLSPELLSLKSETQSQPDTGEQVAFSAESAAQATKTSLPAVDLQKPELIAARLKVIVEASSSGTVVPQQPPDEAVTYSPPISVPPSTLASEAYTDGILSNLQSVVADPEVLANPQVVINEGAENMPANAPKAAPPSFADDLRAEQQAAAKPAPPQPAGIPPQTNIRVVPQGSGLSPAVFVPETLQPQSASFIPAFDAQMPDIVAAGLQALIDASALPEPARQELAAQAQAGKPGQPLSAETLLTRDGTPVPHEAPNSAKPATAAAANPAAPSLEKTNGAAKSPDTDAPNPAAIPQKAALPSVELLNRLTVDASTRLSDLLAPIHRGAERGGISMLDNQSATLANAPKNTTTVVLASLPFAINSTPPSHAHLKVERQEEDSRQQDQEQPESRRRTYTIAMEVHTPDAGLVKVRLAYSGNDLSGTVLFRSASWARQAGAQTQELLAALRQATGVERPSVAMLTDTAGGY